MEVATVAPVTITNWGGLDDSREPRLVLVLLVVVRTKLIEPSALT